MLTWLYQISATNGKYAGKCSEDGWFGNVIEAWFCESRFMFPKTNINFEKALSFRAPSKTRMHYVLSRQNLTGQIATGNHNDLQYTMSDLPDSFHPLIRDWFTQTYGKPTTVQAAAWPLIERGENVLALAPTGSGKTLTAFLSAVSRLCGSGSAYRADRLTVLYVSPLKALNEDIKRNLLQPLGAIRSRFEKAGIPFPDIRVETRSGDTPQAERRRFLSRPPSILALTPESLAIILLNPKGRQVLSCVKYLILDEIHAVLANKRGSYLSCQIDRLAMVAGEFQRISLSATVRPPQATAAFVAGLSPDGKPRPISIVSPSDLSVPAEPSVSAELSVPMELPSPAESLTPLQLSEKQIELTIEYSDELNDIEPGKYGRRYTQLISYILSKISGNSTILVFTDARRRAEKLNYYINEEARNVLKSDSPVSFAHHGSLSKELRQSVERRLAQGSLPCVVATASLELGIDIGNVDEVILAGSPGSVSQAMQRIGRSGHSVGKISRGKLFPFHGMDLLSAAALKNAVEARDIEETHSIENPLDILAQIIIALCAEKPWNIDNLFATIRGFYIFRNLNRESYNRTLNMLTGFGEKGKVREIKQRIRVDSITGEVCGLDGNLLLLYSSGGVIANRGLYSMRIDSGSGTGIKIGELDEEFVWERRVGDSFNFGGKGWKITAIGHEAVEVKPLQGMHEYIPFWRSDTVFRSQKLTEYVLNILDKHNETAQDIRTTNTAKDWTILNSESSWKKSLAAFLDSQQSAQGDAPLSGSANISVEIIESPESLGDLCSVAVHSFRGGAVNYPFSIALACEIENEMQFRVESFSSDDAMFFTLPRYSITESGIKIEEVFRRALAALGTLDTTGGSSMVKGERLLRSRLETSGVFGASFREAAERSLLLPKAGFGKRTPLWIMRQRSKRLFDTASGQDGFPVTAEAWRSCLVDMFDMEGFRELIDSINNGSIAISFFTSKVPSPFSRDLVRQETNTLLYDGDERKDLSMQHGTLSDLVIQEAIGNAAMRPVLKNEIVKDFTGRLRREAAGWVPDDIISLCEWVKERIAIPMDEWETLCAMMGEKTNPDIQDPYLDKRVKKIKRKGANGLFAGIPSIVHCEWEKVWESEPLTMLGPWLHCEGPVSIQRIAEVFGVSPGEAEDAANALAEVGELVLDVALEATPEEVQNAGTIVCDRENLEMMLRLSRRKARPEIHERPANLLIPFFAIRQGLVSFGNTDTETSNLSPVLKKLGGCTAAAKLWESELLTARIKNYSPEMLETELREGRFIWYGSGKEKTGFCHIDDLDLVLSDTQRKTSGGYDSETGIIDEIFNREIASGFFDMPRDFWAIKEEIRNLLPDLLAEKGTAAQDKSPGVNHKNCIESLWQKAWQGRLSADSFEPVRKGIVNGFTPKKEEKNSEQAEKTASTFPQRRIPAALRNRWRDGAPVHGCWFSTAIEKNGTDEDPFDRECRNRDRVRLMLGRWGILCRHIFQHEEPPFSWSLLLPAMRRMELAGEIVAGRFFAGINSLQFASPGIAKELERSESFDGIFWLNAADPASPAGLGIEGLDPLIPGRLPSCRIYFQGSKLIAVSRKNGRDMQIFTEPEDPCLAALIELFKVPRKRKAQPENKIITETINGESATASVYAAAFCRAGFTPDRGRLYLW